MQMGKVTLLILKVLLLLLYSKTALTATLVTDELSPRHNVTIHLGDSIVFKHKNLQTIYIFHSKRAFDLCNVALATVVNNTNSTTSFKWHPSMPGNYYFLIGKHSPCDGEDWRVKVRVIAISPSPAPAPAPTPGGNNHQPLPYERTFLPPSPSPQSSPLLPEPTPQLLPGGKIPFISSNPVIPLPKGDTDDTSIVRPVPVTGAANQVNICQGGTELTKLVFLFMLASALQTIS